MKKIFISLLIFFLTVLQVHGQNIPVIELINKCISLLDKTVPDGFQQLNIQTYINNEGILLLVNNEMVIVSSLVKSFRSNREANEYNALFSDFFKNNNNWDFFRTSSAGAEIYSRDDLRAIIEKPKRANNGSIETMIGFSRRLNVDNM
jgi:hypothetical protein